MPLDTVSIARARSLLFVPGHRPERFSKAVRSGAGAVVLDVEDAVGESVKDQARENIRSWLDNGGEGIVRINDVRSAWYEEDVRMLRGVARTVMLAKTESPDDVLELMSELAPGSCVLPLLETAAGILSARDICSVPGVVRAVFGNADLGRQLAVAHSDLVALCFARSQVVLASAAAGIASPVDGVSPDFGDEESLIRDAEHAAAIGFSGKLCLHPNQVQTVESVFSPSTEEVEWARQVLAAAEGNGSVGVLDGQVIGKPVIERAKRMLAGVERS
ncbi:CoA ester lyase [Saccharomonospora sp. NPDC006951]